VVGQEPEARARRSDPEVVVLVSLEQQTVVVSFESLGKADDRSATYQTSGYLRLG
jgi:hypothetical protein